MSKISIVADDTCVTVDGVGKVFALDNFPADVHAVHYDTLTSTGQVEYKDISKDNEDITSLSDYQAYVDVWNATQTVEENAEEIQEAEIAARTAEEDAKWENRTWVQKRQDQYAKMGNQFEMMYDDAKNGTTVWIDSIEAVKTAVPKE
jgi:hypothetical protein